MHQNDINDSEFIDHIYGLFIKNKVLQNSKYRNEYKDIIDKIDTNLFRQFFGFESIDNDGSVRNVEGWGAKRGPQPLNIPLLN